MNPDSARAIVVWIVARCSACGHRWRRVMGNTHPSPCCRRDMVVVS